MVAHAAHADLLRHLRFVGGCRRTGGDLDGLRRERRGDKRCADRPEPTHQRDPEPPGLIAGIAGPGAPSGLFTDATTSFCIIPLSMW